MISTSGLRFAALAACLQLAASSAPATCVDEGAGCPRGGAAMIQQRAPRSRPSTMLQRGTGEVHDDADAPLARVRTLSKVERASVAGRAHTLYKEAAATGIMLRRAMDAVADINTTNELDKIIFEFMAGQSSSQDACPAKLLEAKHQLNELHRHMYSVAYEINSSSTELKTATKQIQHLQLEWTKTDEDCVDRKEKCTEETSSHYKQWEILKWELIEMKQIANPAVSITGSDMSYAAFKSRVEEHTNTSSESSTSTSVNTTESSEDSGTDEVPEFDGIGAKPPWWPSMLQVADAKADPGNAASSVSALIQGTKNLARDLEHCMAAMSQQGASKVSAKGDPSSSSESSESSGGSSESSTSPPVGSSSSTSGSTDNGGWGNRSSSSDGSTISANTTWSKSFSNTSKNSGNISEACKKQLVAFEVTYYKAYLQITRLITEYEVLVNSTTCVDAVNEECNDQDGQWSLKMEKFTHQLSEFTEKASSVKGHITVMSKEEKSLTLHIQELTTTCADLDETVSSLDKVRDAIHVFSVCAGLGRPNFHIPIFTGQIIEMEYDTTTKTDAEIDADMNALCANLVFDGLTPRAAEIGELMQQAVDGMPTHNTAGSPLIGTCPHCAGDPDVPDGPQHASGHARNCWDAGALLDGATMRTNCGHLSYKAVMCIVDRFTIADATATPSSGTSTSSESSSSSTSSSSTSTSSR